MHYLKAKNGTAFHYNSDMSGNVVIISNGQEIEVNGQDLLEFVAQYLRYERIEEIERQSWREVLGIKTLE